jgi:predicted transposase YdaD
MSGYVQYSLHDFPDRAIRHLLENRDNLRELIAEILPHLVDRFDFDRLEMVSREFLMDDWRRRQSDLLFRLPFRKGEDESPVLVCLLVEHQSAPDPRMPLRMLLYAVLYWEREWKQWEQEHPAGEPLRLSPILPIVFHTGRDAWRTNRELADLIEGPEELRPFAPQWPLLFWDLADYTADSLLEGAGDWLRSLALVRAEQDETEQFLAVFERFLKKLDALADVDRMRWHDLVHFGLSWALRRRPAEENQSIKDIALASYEDRFSQAEVEEMIKAFKSFEDSLFEEGKAEGIAEGIAEGRAEGEVRGKVLGAVEARREDLRGLLTDRFGELSPEVLRNIDATDDLDRLKVAIRQVLRLNSIDDLQL